ncbi:MAG TPA: NapC/NirT family cytochrome c [Candidatus Krumholzibacteria bacterium]|nr:NapC/NirT family cytochrome c [Candidatus Krumholzibacteria bacterium]
MNDESPRANDHGSGGSRRSSTISLFANPISVVGLWIAGVSFVVTLLLMAIEMTSSSHNPYLGIITFVVLPVFMGLGIVVAIFGALRERRRRARGEDDAHWPVLDLNAARQRRALAWISAAAVVFLGLSAFGSLKAYEYTETNEFCGTVCHTVMEPEYTAYQHSAHSRVPCVDCHIGPGAEWFVRSKISGAYQVYAVAADVYPRPIHTPIKNLRPSQDTCENCHWPQKFFGDTYITRNYYLTDEENSHTRLDLMLRVGGGDGREGPREGIHWHMNIANDIEYVAADERRQKIDWFRVTRLDGSVSTYVREGSGLPHDEPPEGEVRSMDCIDCHNRPSHRFLPPQVAMNAAMARGEISTDLAGIKGLGVEILEDEYQSKDEALEVIETTLRDEYADADHAGLVAPAVRAIQEIYRVNYFPQMKTNWKAFPENTGHMWAPGCFRCHNGDHVNEAGESLTRDCNACHVILAEQPPQGDQMMSLVGVDFQHPEDIGELWRDMSCVECHAP